jgi:hypothetical protein
MIFMYKNEQKSLASHLEFWRLSYYTTTEIYNNATWAFTSKKDNNEMEL